MNSFPQTYEEHIEHLRELIVKHSDLQFELGLWLCETIDTFHVTQRAMHEALANEINIGYSTMNDWITTRRFWKTEDLSFELVQRIAQLHEARRDGSLNYSHFRKAKRVGSAQAESRIDRVMEAVTWLEHIVNDGTAFSVVEAETIAIAGHEPFEQMSKVWDSDRIDNLSTKDISHHVEEQLRAIRQKGKRFKVVIYEVSENKGDTPHE